MRTKDLTYFERNLRRLWYASIAIFLTLSSSFGQHPSLKFESDSVGIGDELVVSLKYNHTPEAEVFFPSQAFHFLPFDLVRSEFFTTVTKDSISTDSVIYVINTFDIDKTQFLSLPVWQINGEDTVTIWSNQDTVFLKELVSNLNKTELLSATDLLDGDTSQPLPQWLKMSFFVLTLLALMALLFRDRIERRFKLYNFQKRQRDFNLNFKKLMKQSSTEPKMLKQANSLWRSQMEWIEDEPFNSLSSLEIEKLTQSEKLSQAIREIESSLFGGQKSERIPLALQILYNHVNDRFRAKLQIYRKVLKKN